MSRWLPFLLAVGCAPASPPADELPPPGGKADDAAWAATLELDRPTAFTIAAGKPTLLVRARGHATRLVVAGGKRPVTAWLWGEEGWRPLGVLGAGELHLEV